MTSDLASFQSSFARGLRGQDAATPLAAQAGFAVFRNTAASAWIDALQANYPAVARLVGAEWFRGAALAYSQFVPAADPRLALYGDRLPGFLETACGEQLPYLADVARLDRRWTEAHVAADPDPGSMSAPALAGEALAARIVRPHPAARWAWFDAAPVFTIWSRNRAAEPFDADIEWHGEGALLTRPGAAVQSRAATRAECAFLDACALPAGATLAHAAAAALAAQSDVDLAHLLAGLLRAGALVFPRDESAGDQP